MPGGKYRLTVSRPRSVLLALGCCMIAMLVAGCGAESHPKADLSLLTYVDGAQVIGGGRDCSDLDGPGYIPNNMCISYLLARATQLTSSKRLLVEQRAAFANKGWRRFSASKYAYARAEGWADRAGHDCVIIGSPSATIDSTSMLRPVPAWWPRMLTAMHSAQRRHVALLGVIVYPGPANMPRHERC